MKIHKEAFHKEAAFSMAFQGFRDCITEAKNTSRTMALKYQEFSGVLLQDKLKDTT